MNTSQEIRFYVVQDSRILADGLVKIYLRFFQGKIKKDYYTGIKWPKDRFDKVNEVVMPRYPSDPDFHSHNLKIAQYKSVIHQIRMKAFVSKKETPLQHLIDSLDRFTPFTDFVFFAHTEMRRLHRNNIISYETFRRHRSSINRLVEYFKKETIGIEEITLDRIAEMDGYYHRLGKSNNTIAGYHKDIKNYLNKAIEKELLETNPYAKFKFKYVDGNREPLTQDELRKLMEIYDSKKLQDSHHEVLRRFLFSCLTGIRISDTHRVETDNIKSGKLIFKPKKGLKYGKIVQLPLPQAALKLIKDRDGLLFEKSTDQFINRSLKIIAAYGQIEKNLTYHCARDTFGTIFIELGGDIKTLSDLMGHSSTKITEIYIKMADKRKAVLMSNFDSLF